MGRDEGPGAVHTRWHHMVYAGQVQQDHEQKGLAIFGFASHEGTIRNQGRPGAAKGPRSARHALAQLAFHGGQIVHDHGDVTVQDHKMEEAQAEAGKRLAEIIPNHRMTILLGGGHETTYAGYLGLAKSGALDSVKTWGVVSLDAHFAVRNTPQPSGVTSLRQVIADEKKTGRDFRYSVIGINEADNVRAQFEHAKDLNVSYLKDAECSETKSANVAAFVAEQIADLDLVYLSVDLDALPGYQAPGVSVPASLGVPLIVAEEVVTQVAQSGKVLMMDVVGLNPDYDLDDRTARAAARLIDRATREAFKRPSPDSGSQEELDVLAQREKALHSRGL